MDTTTSQPISGTERSTRRGVFTQALAVWVGLAVVAVLNGVFRGTVPSAPGHG